MSISPPEDQQRLGKYELRERLGYGGVAEVWKAFDTELHRYVAIKLLHADLRTDPEFATRFSREARFIAALHHPNIVQIYDLQTTQSLEMSVPIAYMVMDYVEGETLAHYIRKTSRAGQFPAPTDIVRLFTSISKAVDYAHQEGMIHRDIKPANILLDQRNMAPNSIGEPVLTDFGIARIVGTSSGTMSRRWLGTPLYVSPEQVQGYAGTERSDIYSLGVILYEICTGVCPFRGESITAILMQHVNAAPTPPALINPAISPALAATILRAMAKDPAARFGSASDLTIEIAEAFNLPVPADLLRTAHLLNEPVEPTYLSPSQSGPSPYGTLQGVQQSHPLLAQDSHPRILPSVRITPQFTASPVSGPELPVTPTNSTPASVSQPSAEQNAQAVAPSPASPFKFPPTPLLKRTAESWKVRKRSLLAWFGVLLVLASVIFGVVNAFHPGRVDPVLTTLKAVGTLAFTDSGEYDPDRTVGYNDIVTLSLHNLTPPRTGNAYFVWLIPDQPDGKTTSLHLGYLSEHAGSATLRYASPAHTNLLAQYSRVRVTEQPASDNTSAPSSDSRTWRWEGWVPGTSTSGDAKRNSVLSHLRHLLAQDRSLRKNKISGGLLTWMTHNVGKVEEWSSAAQGEMPNGDANHIHRHLIRILDYLDGQAYVGQDVPAGSPWLAEPALAGTIGLLSYNPDQDPRRGGYLQQVDYHLMGLADAPGHTEEQKKIAMQVHNVIASMIADLTQVRKNAVQLVQRSNEQLLSQPDTFPLLNEMARLTTKVKSGWFDATTNTNLGGVIWLNARIQQLATISLQTSDWK